MRAASERVEDMERQLDEALDGDVIDTRSDLYGAGFVLYEWLTASRPYSSSSLSAVLFQHVHAPIPTLTGDLARFQKLIDNLMAKSPEDRTPNASALMDFLSTLGLEL